MKATFIGEGRYIGEGFAIVVDGEMLSKIRPNEKSAEKRYEALKMEGKDPKICKIKFEIEELPE